MSYKYSFFKRALSTVMNLRKGGSSSSMKYTIGDIRNIGILAHINAGKTTLSEHILETAKEIPIAGDIKSGSTVMDFLFQETERGITIRAAATCLNWNNNRINLIDTPGHVDFSAEVARSVQVLDGAVLVISGPKGVQPQTTRVLSEIINYKLPFITFINKLDKEVSNQLDILSSCLSSIENSIGQTQYNTLPSNITFIPIFIGTNSFSYDLINNTIINNTKSVNSSIVSKYRRDLLEVVACLDESFETVLSSTILEITDENCLYLPKEEIPQSIYNLNSRLIDNLNDKLLISLISLTRQLIISPIIAGAALIPSSVKALLDYTCQFLPPPVVQLTEDKVFFDKNFETYTVGTSFKVLPFDSGKDRLCYLRLNVGSIIPNQTRLINTSAIARWQESRSNDSNISTLLKGEKVTHLYHPKANELEQINELHCGDIGVCRGLKSAIHGDIFCSPAISVRHYFNDYRERVLGRLLLSQLDSVRVNLEPICYSSVSSRHEMVDGVNVPKFIKVLKIFCIEDPSLRVVFDDVNFEYQLWGVGEFQLQLAIERLQREFHMDGVQLSRPRVSYSEALTRQIALEFKGQGKMDVTGIKTVADLPNDNRDRIVSMSLVLSPKNNGKYSLSDCLSISSLLENTVETCIDSVSAALNFTNVTQENIDDIETTVLECLERGPKYNLPLKGVSAKILKLHIGSNLSAKEIRSVIRRNIKHSLISQSVNNGNLFIQLEPAVSVEVFCDSFDTQSNLINLVSFNCNGIVSASSTENYDTNQPIKFTAVAPLAKMFNFTTDCRRVSRGEAHHTLSFAGHCEVDEINGLERQDVKSLQLFADYNDKSKVKEEMDIEAIKEKEIKNHKTVFGKKQWRKLQAMENVFVERDLPQEETPDNSQNKESDEEDEDYHDGQ